MIIRDRVMLAFAGDAPGHGDPVMVAKASTQGVSSAPSRSRQGPPFPRVAGEFESTSLSTRPKFAPPRGHGALNYDDLARPMDASRRSAAMRATVEMHEMGVALGGLEVAPVASQPFTGNEPARGQGNRK